MALLLLLLLLLVLRLVGLLEGQRERLAPDCGRPPPVADGGATAVDAIGDEVELDDNNTLEEDLELTIGTPSGKIGGSGSAEMGLQPLPAFQRLGHGNEYEWDPPHLMHK